MSDSRSLNPLVPVVKLMAKYLPKDDLSIGLIVPLIILIPIFLFVQMSNPENLQMNLKIFGGIYVGLTVWMFISNAYGKRRHETALNSGCLSQLREMGFDIENIKDYWGYKGIYKNYFFRIYYDWNTMLPGRNNFREIGIVLFYTPPKSDYYDFDRDALNELNKKYKNSWWMPKPFEVNFEADYLILHTPFHLFTSFKKIKSRIHLALKIATDEKLVPISEQEVAKLIAQNSYWYGPTIETFQDAYKTDEQN